MRLLLCAIDPCLSVGSAACDCERRRRLLGCHHLYRLDSFPLLSLPSFPASSPRPTTSSSPPPLVPPFSERKIQSAPALATPLPPLRSCRTSRFVAPLFLLRAAGGSEVFLIQFRRAVLAGEALLEVQQDCCRARRPQHHSWAASICAGVRFDWRGVFLETYNTGAPIRRRVPARSDSPSLMRLSHCESNCADPLCYIPCLPKSKDAPGAGADALSSAAPCPVAVAEDKPPPVQKMDSTAAVEAEKDGCEGGKDGDGEKTLAAARPPPKSNLKKPNCDGDGACAPKGNVKWLDLLGKDLTEVKEFEPSESGDSMDDGDGMSGCVCVIQ